MKNKIIQFIPTILALAVIGFSYFSQWCTATGQICFRTLLDQMFPYITSPLYFFFLFSLPISIILILIPRSVFNSWFKFAVWAIPLLLIFIATQPVYATHILSTDRDDAATFASQIFSITSLIVMFFSFLLSRLHTRIGNDSEKIDYETKRFKALFAASVGFIAIISFLLGILLNAPFELIGIFLFVGVASILANLYALFYTIILCYGKRQRHTPFDRQLIVTLFFIGSSIIGYVTVGSLLFFLPA